MKPRGPQPRFSAHTGIGGRTTRADRSATATFLATMRPRSRNSGSDEDDRTATPATAVTTHRRPAQPEEVT